MAAGQEKKSWDSWEELILVCLVDRHGLERWDEIAREVQCRAREGRPLFTKKECINKFAILRQQFIASRQTSGDGEDENSLIKSMTKEFNNIHQEILRRYLKAYDDQEIEELKKKEADRIRIREESKKLKAKEEEVGELGTMADGAADGGEANEDKGDERSLKMVGGEKRIDDGGDESGGVGYDENEPDLVDDGGDESGGVGYDGNEPDPVEEPVRNLILEENRTMMSKVLKRLQKRKGCRKLEHKLRSMATTEAYRRTIRQHMDFDIIQSMINQEEYVDSFQMFFRDLLLLFNNAIVIFENNTPEHTTALKLREVVRIDMNKIMPAIPPREVVLGLPASTSELGKFLLATRKPWVGYKESDK